MLFNISIMCLFQIKIKLFLISAIANGNPLELLEYLHKKWDVKVNE